MNDRSRFFAVDSRVLFRRVVPTRSSFGPPSRHLLAGLLLAMAFGLLSSAAPLAAAEAPEGRRELRQWIDQRTAALPEHHGQWLRDVEPIISDAERVLFLEQEKDYHRDAFIERFWRVRDPYPSSARNELREDYMTRLREARAQFGDSEFDDRIRMLLINGFPAERVAPRCRPYLGKVEVWSYPNGSERYRGEFLVLLYQRDNMGPYRLWEFSEGLDVLSGEPFGRVTLGGIRDRCGLDGEAVIAAVNFLRAQGGNLGSASFLGRLIEKPETPQKEWVESFGATSTEVPDDAAAFEATLAIDYPGRQQSRTIVQGAVGVATGAVEATRLDEEATPSINLLLNGEILRQGKLFDSFRYQFAFTPEDGPILPLVFQRPLRPGDYTLMVRVEDLGSGRYYREERALTVPLLNEAPPPPMNAETARLLEEANAAIRTGDVTVAIAPLRGAWQTGLVRIDALTTGDGVDRVVFSLDDQPILTKKSPPYQVELDLGNVPRSRVVRVEAHDADGTELAADELLINAGDHRFGVRLEEPRRGKTYRRSLRVEADLQVPKGETVERVEIYLDEERVATLYQEPWVHPLVLPEENALAYVRAVAYTPDGRSAEDLVFVNAPEGLEEVEVDFVELYTAAVDRDQRPVDGLTEANFRVVEDEVPQEIVRFERVENLPIHVAVMLDVSASMEDRLPIARDAALRFFRQAVQPRDRAAVITFNDHPNLAVELTRDVDDLAAGLAGLKAERGTALWDSLIFSLYYFNGIRGQRAILLLSDGKDESSRFDFDDALEYARRAGVSLYVIGLDLKRSQGDARRKLARLADETGGRSFFLDTAIELPAVYDQILEELRSRYLIAYQSSNTGDGFRSIAVEVDRPGVEAKTLRGYFP